MNRKNIGRFPQRVGIWGCIMFGLLSVTDAQTAEEFKSSVTAEHWISMCRPILEARVKSDGKLEIMDTFETGQCAGAFDTISVLGSLTDHGKPVLGFCAPPAHTLPQWVAIFADYTKRHPKRYTEPFAFVAIAALQEVYPCPKK